MFQCPAWRDSWIGDYILCRWFNFKSNTRKDVLSVWCNDNKKKEKKRKRLLLDNISNIYKKFQKLYPDHEIEKSWKSFLNSYFCMSHLKHTLFAILAEYKDLKYYFLVYYEGLIHVLTYIFDWNVLPKACVCHFLRNFYFSPNNSPSKTMKDVFYFI